MSFFSDSANFSVSALGSHLKTPTDVIANAALAPSKGVMKMTAEPGLIAFRYAISALFTSLNTNDELNTVIFQFPSHFTGVCRRRSRPPSWSSRRRWPRCEVKNSGSKFERPARLRRLGEVAKTRSMRWPWTLRVLYVVGNTRSANLPTVNPIQASHSVERSFDRLSWRASEPETLEPVFCHLLRGTR